MAKILAVRGRQVWDSRGKATVEAEVVVGRGTTPLATGRAIAPAGASTGSGEAKTIEVRKAVHGINTKINDALRALPAGDQAAIDRRLIEMDFGAWEGKRLADLRAEPDGDAAAREALGLDFKAPGGESPRAVQARLEPLLARLAELRRPTVLVTHKAVIRALYALATGWTMIGKPPAKLRPNCAQVFRLQADGAPVVEELNVTLER